MSKTGAIVGVAVLGVAAIAWMNMERPDTTVLPPSPAPPSLTPTNPSALQPTVVDCSRVWNNDGERINNEWVELSTLGMGVWNRKTCGLNGARVKINADKTYYVAGETMNILIFKKYYVTDWAKEWRDWCATTKYGDEYLSFYIGIEDLPSLHKLRNYGQYIGTKYSWNNIAWGGALNQNDVAGYCAVKLSIPLTEDDVGVYKVTSKVVLGPYGVVGVTNCGEPSGECPSGRNCNYRKETSTRRLTVLNRTCSEPPVIENGNSASENYASENTQSKYTSRKDKANGVWSMTHQSYMSEWVC